MVIHSEIWTILETPQFVLRSAVWTPASLDSNSRRQKIHLTATLSSLYLSLLYTTVRIFVSINWARSSQPFCWATFRASPSSRSSPEIRWFVWISCVSISCRLRVSDCAAIAWINRSKPERRGRGVRAGNYHSRGRRTLPAFIFISLFSCSSSLWTGCEFTA